MRALAYVRRQANLSHLRRLARDESGAALVEYGMLVGLIACVCIAGVTLLGTTVNGVFTAINGALGPIIAGIPGG